MHLHMLDICDQEVHKYTSQVTQIQLKGDCISPFVSDEPFKWGRSADFARFCQLLCPTSSEVGHSSNEPVMTL